MPSQPAHAREPQPGAGCARVRPPLLDQARQRLEIGNGYAQAGDREGATGAYEAGRRDGQVGARDPAERRGATMDRLGLAYGFTDRSDGSRPLLRGSYALDQNRRSLVELRHVDRRKTGVLELQTQNSRVAEPAR